MAKGVSPLFATVVLVALTISAGAIAYILIQNWVASESPMLDVQLVSVKLMKTSGAILVSATARNSGTVQITSCTVTIRGDGGNSTLLELGSIAPGKTASKSVVNPPDFDVTVGHSYVAKVRAEAPDGSAIEKIVPTVCVGG